MVYGHPTLDAAIGHLMTDAIVEDHHDNFSTLAYAPHGRGDIEAQRWRSSVDCGPYISVSDIGHQ